MLEWLDPDQLLAYMDLGFSIDWIIENVFPPPEALNAAVDLHEATKQLQEIKELTKLNAGKRATNVEQTSISLGKRKRDQSGRKQWCGYISDRALHVQSGFALDSEGPCQLRGD
jgi:hypothetical protein